MTDKVTINHHTSGKVEIVQVGGFMGMAQVAPFEDVVDRLIKANSVSIVLDFTKLQYISSAGLGVIIGRIREVRKQNGDIKIGGCSPVVMNILKVFGFTDVFTVANTPEEAIQLFGE